MLSIVGIVLILVAGGLFWYRRSQQGKLLEIQSTPTSTAQELLKASEYVAQRLGEPGSFKQIAEIKGVAKADNPIESEIAKQPCLYYSMSVTREYEESYWETDSQSKQQVRKTRRESETVSSNSQRIPFWVEDATGPTWVDPEGADIEGVQVVDRFDNNTGGVISFGGFSFDVGAFGGILSGDRRTLGYRFRETILPVARDVFVLGEAADSSGKLRVQRPSTKGKKFIISVKSEEELIRSIGSTIRWLMVGSIGCAGVGAVLVIAGLMK